MTFGEKIKTSVFWKKTLQIAITFFVILFILSLLFNSFSALIKFDIESIIAENFSDGKWKRFFLSKIVISLLYGIWVTNKHMK